MANSYSKKEVPNSLTLKHLSWSLKLKNFFGAFQLFEYTIQEENQSFILISRECIEDTDILDNYLEDFLGYFNRENWESKELLEQYCEIFKEIDPKLFPKVFLAHKHFYVDEELKKYHGDILELIKNTDLLFKDSTELCWRLSKMVDYLRDIRKAELIMDRVNLNRYR